MTYSDLTPEELASEEWRPVIGYEGWYIVSSLGRVRRVKSSPYSTGQCLKPGFNGGGDRGYGFVKLYGPERPRLHYVHILVARAFLGPAPEGQEVNHKDGIKANCRSDNLEYKTKSGNHIHRCRVLGKGRGASHHHASINEATASKIKTQLRRGEGDQEIANECGCSLSVVRKIKYGKSWLHVD